VTRGSSSSGCRSPASPIGAPQCRPDPRASVDLEGDEHQLALPLDLDDDRIAVLG
jgi:hypothetical protein